MIAEIESSLDETVRCLKPVELGSLPPRPLVSVLIPNYNYARFIPSAIESVLRQSYQHFEIYICDDGSTDDSWQVIESYVARDPRIHAVRKPNGGMGSAHYRAFRDSKGQVICLLDSDDRFLPEKLQIVVDAFCSHPRSGFLMNKMLSVDGDARRLGVTPIRSISSGWVAPSVLRHGGGLPAGMAATSGICMRREIADLVLPLTEHFSRNNDLGVLSLASLMTPLIGIDIPLSEYRWHGANDMATSSITPEWLARALKALRAVWELQHSYLEKVTPDLARSLAPVETSGGVLLMTYALARLRGDESAIPAYKKLVRSGSFATLAAHSRWFWRISILLPRFVVQKAINLAWGPSRPKQWITSLTRYLRVS
jgi:glycosyltransferase involved in cell wall biosynthesis